MSAINLPGPLSSTLVCNICSKNLMLCTCSKSAISASMTGNLSGGSGVSFTAGGVNASSYIVGGVSGSLNTVCGVCGLNIFSCQCSYTIAPNTYTFPCKTCGQSLSMCQCLPANTIQVPFIGGPWTTTGTYTGPFTNQEAILGYLNDIELLDAETKNVHKHDGWFAIRQRDDKDGLYGYVNKLFLPNDLKDVFGRLRENVWQIRSPLVVQLNVKVIDKEDPEFHFMTLISIESAEFQDDHVVLTHPNFQEIMSTLELMRLLELQRVFTKLLRRI